MTLIDQDKEFRRLALDLALFADRDKFGIDSSNDRGTSIIYELDQMLPGLGLFGGLAAVLERIPDLVVQVDAIGDEHYPRILNRLLQGQGFGQHHHGYGLAGAGSMPDHAALAVTLAVPFAHPL
ncbi:hypothetical protein ES708_25116 [subsurface metagenome]